MEHRTIGTFQRGANWRSKLSLSTKFLRRWGWFILLSVILMTVCSYVIPDSASSDSYQATLQVQVRSAGNGISTDGKATTSFFAGLLASPGILNLALTRLHAYPQFKDYQLVDLQNGLVTASVIRKTNVISLTGYGETLKDASLIATSVYNALIEKIHLDRSVVIDGINMYLNDEAVQVQNELANTETTLRQLAATNQTTSSQYTLFSNMHVVQKRRLDTINRLQLILRQQGYDNLLDLASATPAVTTVPAATATRNDRLTLSPLIGLLMGLGGALVASRFSTSLPLRGKKRNLVLPQVVAAVPVFQNLREVQTSQELLAQRLQRHAFRLMPLLRRMRYQASEHEERLQLITVSSPHESEGKSTVATCMAIAAAQSGLRTLLVDVNPRRPVVHSYFQLPDASGSLNAIRSLAIGTIEQAPVHSTVLPKLGILPIGKLPRNSETAWEEPLRVDGLRPFIERLRQQADMIICDGPSILYDTNISGLATLSDAVLLVVDAQKSQSAAVLEATTRLSEIGASFSIVLNSASSGFVE